MRKEKRKGGPGTDGFFGGYSFFSDTKSEHHTAESNNAIPYKAIFAHQIPESNQFGKQLSYNWSNYQRCTSGLKAVVGGISGISSYLLW